MWASISLCFSGKLLETYKEIKKIKDSWFKLKKNIFKNYCYEILQKFTEFGILTA